MLDRTKTTPEKLAEMNDSLIVDNSYLRGQLLEIRAENEALTDMNDSLIVDNNNLRQRVQELSSA